MYVWLFTHPAVVNIIRSAGSQLVGAGGGGVDGSGEDRRSETDEGSELDEGEHGEEVNRN